MTCVLFMLCMLLPVVRLASQDRTIADIISIRTLSEQAVDRFIAGNFDGSAAAARESIALSRDVIAVLDRAGAGGVEGAPQKEAPFTVTSVRRILNEAILYYVMSRNSEAARRLERNIVIMETLVVRAREVGGIVSRNSTVIAARETNTVVVFTTNRVTDTRAVVLTNIYAIVVTNYYTRTNIITLTNTGALQKDQIVTRTNYVTLTNIQSAVISNMFDIASYSKDGRRFTAALTNTFTLTNYIVYVRTNIVSRTNTVVVTVTNTVTLRDNIKNPIRTNTVTNYRTFIRTNIVVMTNRFTVTNRVTMRFEQGGKRIIVDEKTFRGVSGGAPAAGHGGISPLLIVILVIAIGLAIAAVLRIRRRLK